MALKYVTTEEFGETINIVSDIPSWAVGTNPVNEVVGDGDNSNTKFYLDQKNIVDASYSLFASGAAFDETTNYTLDKDIGEITLTLSGVATLGTDSLTAKYKYFNNGMSNSYITKVIERAEAKVDNETNTTFTDGTATNPSYTVKTEIQSSPGYFREQIISDNKPLIDVTTTISGVMTISATTVDLTTGTGKNFPSSGNVIIDSEAISYTGITTDQLTGVSRGILGTTSGAHTDLSPIHSTMLFLSNTQEGTAATYTVQPWNTYMHASDTGLFYSYNQSTFNTSQFPDRLTKQDVADRVKLVYYYGYDTIPADIKRLSIIFGKEMLLKDSIGSSLISGRDEFNPRMMDTEASEAESIINSYIVIPMGNV